MDFEPKFVLLFFYLSISFFKKYSFNEEKSNEKFAVMDEEEENCVFLFNSLLL